MHIYAKNDLIQTHVLRKRSNKIKAVCIICRILTDDEPGSKAVHYS